MSPTRPTHLLASLTARPTVRHLFKVLTGNIGGNALNLLALVLLAAWLDDERLYGLFGLAYFTLLLIAQLADFGLNTTIVKYYREHRVAGEPEMAEALLRRSLLLRLLIVSLLSGSLMLAARPLVAWGAPEALAGLPGLPPGRAVLLFRLVCLGAIGSVLWSFAQASMQARERFGWYGALTFLNHAIRLALIVGLHLLGRLDLTSALVAVALVPWIGFLLARPGWPTRAQGPPPDPVWLRRRIGSILHFSKWIFISTVINSVVMRLDLYLIQILSDLSEVGIYTLAVTLAIGFQMSGAALATVLLPRLAAERRREWMLETHRWLMRALPWLAAVLVLAIAVAYLALPWIADGIYTGSAPVFALLATSFALVAWSAPLSFFCLAFDRAHWLTILNILELAINFTIGILLIPSFGAVGAAGATLAMSLFAAGYLLLMFRRLLAISLD